MFQSYLFASMKVMVFFLFIPLLLLLLVEEVDRNISSLSRSLQLVASNMVMCAVECDTERMRVQYLHRQCQHRIDEDGTNLFPLCFILSLSLLLSLTVQNNEISSSGFHLTFNGIQQNPIYITLWRQLQSVCDHDPCCCCINKLILLVFQRPKKHGDNHCELSRCLSL